MKGLFKELLDYLLVCIYYRLFVRPRPAARAAPEWRIDLTAMKAAYRGPKQAQGHDPLEGITMTFYLAGDGEGSKKLCGGLDPIPAETQTTLNAMNPRRQKQLLRRLIEEGDCVFRSAWERSAAK